MIRDYEILQLDCWWFKEVPRCIAHEEHGEGCLGLDINTHKAQNNIEYCRTDNKDKNTSRVSTR